MIIPLKKTTKEGEPYHRRPEIERGLNELDCLASDDLVERLTSTQQPVPLEILIYYLRHSELGLTAKHLEPIFHTFYSRLEAALRKTVSNAWIDHALTIREEIAGRVVEMIAEDRNSHQEKMYYWETNFNDALAKLRTDVLRKLGPARASDPLINAEPLDHRSDDGNEIRPEIDIAAIDFINPDPSRLDDVAFRLRLNDAIIDRTVRNRLRRAYGKLRGILQEEETS